MSGQQFRVEVQYGHSPQPLCCFWPGSSTGSISLGTRGAWRLHAPGVEEFAAYLYFDGNDLFICSLNPSVPVSVNAAPVTSGWIALKHTDVIDIGQARLNVSETEPVRHTYVAPPEATSDGPPPPAFQLAAGSAPPQAYASQAPAAQYSQPPAAQYSQPPAAQYSPAQAQPSQAPQHQQAPAQPAAPGTGFEPAPNTARMQSQPPSNNFAPGRKTVRVSAEELNLIKLAEANNASDDVYGSVHSTRAISLPSRLTAILEDPSAPGLLPENQLEPPTTKQPLDLIETRAPVDLGAPGGAKKKGAWAQASLPQKIIMMLMPFALIATWFTLGPGKNSKLLKVFRSEAPATVAQASPAPETTDQAGSGSADSDELAEPSEPDNTASPSETTATDEQNAPAPTTISSAVPPPSPSGAEGTGQARVAADALISGDYQRALAEYRSAAKQQPKDVALQRVVTILEHKLRTSTKNEQKQ